jgi:hypothetical protein
MRPKKTLSQNGQAQDLIRNKRYIPDASEVVGETRLT